MIQKAFQAVTGAGAIGFSVLVYAYLTVPDVRPLIKENPSMTAFMRLRDEEARRNRPEQVGRERGHEVTDNRHAANVGTPPRVPR